jgi:hypothetical protein
VSASSPSAAPQQPQPLALHIAETTLSFPLRAAEVRRLSEALTGVMQTFAEKQAAERPKRWPAMEYVFKGALTWLPGCGAAALLLLAGRDGGREAERKWEVASVGAAASARG